MTFRGFIALDIEPNDGIRKFMEGLEKTGAPLKMVNPNNIHITMKFLGDTEEDKVREISEVVRRVLAEREPFTIELKGAGAFPHLGYMKVVWIGTEEEPKLKNTAHRIEEELVPVGFPRDDKGFSPHITVARVKGGKNKERLSDTIKNYEDFHFKTEKVTKLKLMKSTLTKKGPIYETLEEYYL
ncbi:MAG: RNA 2',3'-cyclic phosphodiesterase [Candidatus Saliniplasma sp.]